jgi:signal transduction protein with GAF and PtsI domain
MALRCLRREPYNLLPGSTIVSEMTACHPLCTEIENRLAKEGPSDAALQAILDQLLSTFGCAVGTLHRLDGDSGMLRLCVQRGLPEALLERVQLIPIGKGMAGLAAERRVPVQVCNLQTDTSGAAKPAAKETGMQGSCAVPMLLADRLCGVLGVAKSVACDFSEAEITALLQIARSVGKFLDGARPTLS